VRVKVLGMSFWRSPGEVTRRDLHHKRKGGMLLHALVTGTRCEGRAVCYSEGCLRRPDADGSAERPLPPDPPPPTDGTYQMFGELHSVCASGSHLVYRFSFETATRATSASVVA